MAKKATYFSEKRTFFGKKVPHVAKKHQFSLVVRRAKNLRARTGTDRKSVSGLVEKGSGTIAGTARGCFAQRCLTPF